MGIISNSQDDNNDDKKVEQNSQKIPEKEPKDNIKVPKNNKKPKNSKKNKNKNIEKISDNFTKKIFTNKIIKSKNKNTFYSNKTFQVKKSHSKEKPKIKLNKEIKNIIFQNKNRNAISQDKKEKEKKFIKKRFNKKTENIKHNINYNNFSKALDDNDYDIIYNDDDEDYDESLEDINEKIKTFHSNKIKNKILKEKISNTKKKIINLRKKLNTGINNSSKNMNIKNKNKNEIIMTNKIIKPNKISNTIFINNSNITISNTDRNFHKENNITKKKDNSVLTEFNNYNNNLYNNETYINPNFRSIEIEGLLQNVFQEKISLNNSSSIDQNKTNKKLNKINNNFYYTESNYNFNTEKPKKEYNKDLSLSHQEINRNKRPDDIIISKMEELKEQIKLKLKTTNTPSNSRTINPINNKKTVRRIKKNEILDIRHLKHNIPSYRRSYSKSNNINTPQMNNLLENVEKNKNIKDKTYPKSLLNSNTKKKQMKSNYNFSFKKREKNKAKDIGNSQDEENKNNKSSQLNDSSLKNISNIEPLSETKRIKNKRLFNLITQNFINNEGTSNNDINNDDINNIDEILSVKYRDAFEIDITSVNIKDSLIDKELIESNINNKIIVNFSKLKNISTSQILFDGIIYKVVDNCSNDSEKKFKIMERYFQLKKNCFRYFNNIQLARYNQDKPLVQFDIRHIKDLKIIDNKIFDEYDLNGKKIEFAFSIFLNQNSDFFVFILDNKNFGNSLFGLINLLKNYYEDIKN